MTSTVSSRTKGVFGDESVGIASTEIAATARVPRIVENFILILRSWVWVFLREEEDVEVLFERIKVFEAFEVFDKLCWNVFWMLTCYGVRWWFACSWCGILEVLGLVGFVMRKKEKGRRVFILRFVALRVNNLSAVLSWVIHMWWMFQTHTYSSVSWNSRDTPWPLPHGSFAWIKAATRLSNISSHRI